MIIGLPGSGKTIVAQQYVFRNGTPERPSVYFSTVSEPLKKLLRFGQTLDFFDADAIGTSVFYEDLGDTLNKEGLAGLTERVSAVLRERRPGLIVIDSFKALTAFSPDPGEFRRFLHEFAGRLSVSPTASLWVGEYEESEIASGPEFAVADAIIGLVTVRSGEREMRLLQVRKLRGSDFLSGRHAYRLARQRPQPVPRLADPPRRGPLRAGPNPGLVRHRRSGHHAGRRLLAGRIDPHRRPFGVGEDAHGPALHLQRSPARGARDRCHAAGEPHPASANRRRVRLVSAGSRGLRSCTGPPSDIYIDEWVYDLLAAAERTGAKRILVDSLADLRMTTSDEIRFREFLYSLIQRCSRAGISLMMTMEIPDLFGVERLSEFGISHLSDNVVLLNYFIDRGSIKRAMSVTKTRASRHEPEIREFSIDPTGIVLGDIAPFGKKETPGTPAVIGGPKL